MDLPDLPRTEQRRARFREYARRGEWTAPLLSDLAYAAIRNDSQTRIDIELDDGLRSFTLSEILRLSLPVAAGYAERGIGTQNVVCAVVPGGLSAVTSYYASIVRGAIFCPIPIYYSPSDIAQVIERVNPDLIVSTEEWFDSVGRDFRQPTLKIDSRSTAPLEGMDSSADSLEKLFAPSLPDRAQIIAFTSGTTSAPKLVLNSMRGVSWNAVHWAQHSGLTDRDVEMIVAPPGHIVGVYAFNSPLLFGSGLVALERWVPARAYEAIKEVGVTSTNLSTFWLDELLSQIESRGALSSLHHVITGGDIPKEALLERAERAGLTVSIAYGTSELGCIAQGTSKNGGRHNALPVLPGFVLRIVDGENNEVATGENGEILVQSPSEFLGYLDPDMDVNLITADGWCRTGDIGNVISGTVQIVGRTGEMIIRGGENISLPEIDALLESIPGVSEAAAVGVRDPRGGERLVACVVIDEGSDVLSMASLIDYCRNIGISMHKVPKRLLQFESLPRTSISKIDRSALRDQAIARLDAIDGNANSRFGDLDD